MPCAQMVVFFFKKYECKLLWRAWNGEAQVVPLSAVGVRGKIDGANR